MKSFQRQIILLLLLTASLLSYGQSNAEPLPTFSPKGSLSLRTNLITWAMLTPNVGTKPPTMWN